MFLKNLGIGIFQTGCIGTAIIITCVFGLGFILASLFCVSQILCGAPYSKYMIWASAYVVVFILLAVRLVVINGRLKC